MKTLKHFEIYNERRYSTPWVATIKDGKYDFANKVGYYTGNNGDEGDIVVTDPQQNVIYAYGQKDYRGGNTSKDFAIWDGEKFVKCDKAGRTAEESK